MGFSKKEAPNCDWCPYKKQCFFSSLDRSAQKEWKEIRVANRFNDEETVFYDGERPQGLYVVCSGKVKVAKTHPGGQQLITRILAPGQLVGQRSLLAGENYSGSAIAMQESVVSMIEYPSFEKFLKSNPEAALTLLKNMAREMRVGEDKARDLAYKPARSRLSDVLLKLMHKNGSPKPDVQGVKRREMAEMAGLTVETTVRLLNDFEKQGLVRRNEKSISILNEERLRTISSLFN